VPFYYIEYGIALLGAIGLGNSLRRIREQALNNYITALAQGGTRTLPELFKSAGFILTFSPLVVGNLMSFVHSEMQALTKE
jgi:oligoendopeptidase F